MDVTGGENWEQSTSGAVLQEKSYFREVWAWGYRPVILALGRLRQEDLEFDASLGYIVRLLISDLEVQASLSCCFFISKMGARQSPLQGCSEDSTSYMCNMYHTE
jgi:hypothetical protein